MADSGDRKLYKDLIRRELQMIQDRDQMFPHWKELRDYINPLRGSFSDRLTGQTRRNLVDMRRVITSTALSSAGVLASGLQSGLTSPSRNWFSLSVRDPESTSYEVKDWLEIVQDRMQQVMASSNYYEELHSAYEELATFGNACMFIETDADNTIHCKTMTAGTYTCDVDANDRVIAFSQQRFLSLEAIYDKFKDDNLPKDVLKAWEVGAWDSRYRVHHMVVRDKQSSTRRYKSIWFMDEDGGTIVRQSRFYEMPVMFARWSTLPDHVYGWGCGTKALGDVRQLMRMTKDLISSIGKQVEPPLLVHNSMRGQTIRTSPSNITYTSGENDIDKFITPLYGVNLNLNELRQTIIDKQNDIRTSFYVDLFMMISEAQGQMTATEVLERRQEKMTALGPVLERLENELLSPSIKRIFAMMMREDMLPQPPEALGQREIKIEYVSILAQAQKSSEIPALSQFIGNYAQMLQAFPEIVDKVNPDEIVNAYHNLSGAPIGILRTDAEVAQIRNDRAEAQAQSAAMDAQSTLLNQGVQAAEGAELLSQSGAIGNQVLENTLASVGMI